jgi:hypothetical protein
MEWERLKIQTMNKRNGDEPAKHIRGSLPLCSAFTVVVFVLIRFVHNFFRNDFLSGGLSTPAEMLDIINTHLDDI